jgi:hypothetical protein
MPGVKHGFQILARANLLRTPRGVSNLMLDAPQGRRGARI